MSLEASPALVKENQFPLFALCFYSGEELTSTINSIKISVTKTGTHSITTNWTFDVKAA